MLVDFFLNDFYFSISVYALVLFAFIIKFDLLTFIFTILTILLMISASITTDNNIFIISWALSSITLLLSSISTKTFERNTYYFKKYLTYIAGDILFFSLAILFPSHIRTIVFLPIIIKAGLIPFNFFSISESGKSLVKEYQHITLNFLLVIIFLAKYNYNNSILSFILLATIFFTSFGLLRKDDSTNIISAIYTICLQACILLFINESYSLAKIAIFTSSLTMLFLTFLISDNIPKTVLSPEGKFRLTSSKLISILLIFSYSIVPVFFSSNIFLGTMELASFYSWANKSSHYFTPIYFIFIAWFLINFNWALIYLSKLVLYNIESKHHKALRLVFLPIIIFFISNYPYTGKISVFSNSPLSPVSNISHDFANYIIYFYTPIIIFSLLGILLQFLFGNRVILRKICFITFSILSLRVLYDNLKFSSIQNFVSNLINSYYIFCKSISKFAITLKINLYTGLNVVLIALNSLKEPVTYIAKLNLKIKPENIAVYLILFFLSFLAFLSNLKDSLFVIIFLLLINFIFIIISTNTNEEEK